MPLYYLILIAVIQGVTEFLPVSSSGHLVLLPQLTGIKDQGVVIDVAAHIGTLFAVILYFWRDVVQALIGLGHLLRGHVQSPPARLALGLIIATIPVVVLGLILKVTGLVDLLRSVTVIGWSMLIFGVVLYIADQRGPQTKTMGDWSMSDAIKMGLWQALALIPGTSRSGAAITGAMVLGYSRAEGARIAMLMSIPTIIASGTLSSLDLIGGHVPIRDTAIVVVLSFIAALIALRLMMRLLQTISFTPYVIYRVALGVILLILAYTGVLT